MSGHICLSFHVVVDAYVMAVYRQVCWPYCALQPCHTDVQLTVLLVNSSCTKNTGRGWQRKPAGYVQPAAAGAPAACVAYGVSGPCHGIRSRQTCWATGHRPPDWLRSRYYRSIANGCWLITSARVYCQCGCPIYRHNTRRNGARFLQQVYRKDTSVCPNNLISISVTISISASWFVGAFVCRRVGLSASWSVCETGVLPEGNQMCVNMYDVIEMCAPAAPPIRLRIRTRSLNPNP